MIIIIDKDINEGWISFQDSDSPGVYFCINHSDMEEHILTHMDEVAEYHYNYPDQSETISETESEDITDDELVSFILRHRKLWVVEQE